jgi:hypothetical protein
MPKNTGNNSKKRNPYPAVKVGDCGSPVEVKNRVHEEKYHSPKGSAH